jgi:hypothetical protein
MFLRSMFAARGIAIVVGAEHHASLFGAMNNSFLSLDIWVLDEDSEEALALLRDLREHGGAAGGAEIEADDDGPGESVQLQLERRRRTAVVLLTGLFLTFGTAHMYTRAWLRGLALATIQLAGILEVIHRHPAGGVAVVAAVLTDLVGAMWRVRGDRTALLPAAQVHRVG